MAYSLTSFTIFVRSGPPFCVSFILFLVIHFPFPSWRSTTVIIFFTSCCPYMYIRIYLKMLKIDHPGEEDVVSAKKFLHLDLNLLATILRIFHLGRPPVHLPLHARVGSWTERSEAVLWGWRWGLQWRKLVYCSYSGPRLSSHVKASNSSKRTNNTYGTIYYTIHKIGILSGTWVVRG